MFATAEEYLEVVSGEFLRLSRLSPIQHLCFLEEFQVLVVRDDLNLVVGSFQISVTGRLGGGAVDSTADGISRKKGYM